MKTSYHVEDGKEYIGHREDLTPHIQAAHDYAGLKTRSERMGDMPLLMKVPDVVAVKIMNETGLNFFDPGDWQEIWKILKRDWAIFKATPHNL